MRGIGEIALGKARIELLEEEEVVVPDEVQQNEEAVEQGVQVVHPVRGDAFQEALDVLLHLRFQARGIHSLLGPFRDGFLRQPFLELDLLFGHRKIHEGDLQCTGDLGTLEEDLRGGHSLVQLPEETREPGVRGDLHSIVEMRPAVLQLRCDVPQLPLLLPLRVVTGKKLGQTVEKTGFFGRESRFLLWRRFRSLRCHTLLA